MDIHYAHFLANELYGVNISQDKFEELALIAHHQIGNKVCRTYRFFGAVDPQTLSIELPCNFTHLISVTCAMEDWEHVTNKHWNGDIDSAYIEHYIENSKLFMDPLYQPGKFLNYEKVGNTLYFDRPYGLVGILYKGEVVNDDGLPDVNDKEAEAIAAYVAYTQMYKEGLKTRNTVSVNLAMNLEKQWNTLRAAARTPEYISQNEMDQILDAKTNWNRKQFRKTYKPIL